jgi:predicted nucleic acid-binding protein
LSLFSQTTRLQAALIRTAIDDFLQIHHPQERLAKRLRSAGTCGCERRRVLPWTNSALKRVHFEHGHVAFVSKLPNDVVISGISVAELYACVRDGTETQALSDLLDALEVIDLNRDIAQIGGLIRRDIGKSNGLGLNDALIAASRRCIRHACLYTMNVKHYPSLGKNQVRRPYRKA